MPAYVFRCRMADRPGALGQVASRIGALRADIISVAVHRRTGGIVIDEFLIDLPDDVIDATDLDDGDEATGSERLADLVCAEIEEVDGVKVESRWMVDDGQINLTLTNLVWFELLTDDCDAAGAFYTEALGWRTEPITPFGDGTYHVIFPNNGLTPAGGIVHYPKAIRGSAPAGAVVYVEVDDLDASLASFQAAGGVVRSTTREDPHSSAVVADPWGNRLGLWQT